MLCNERPILVVMLAVFVLSLQAASGAAQDIPPGLENDECVSCHFDLEEFPVGFSVDDVHLKPGLSCSGCHGGDPTTDDDIEAKSTAGFVASPLRSTVPTLCGSCHSDIAFMRDYQPRSRTDQLDQYWTSGHGVVLAADASARVAQCADCHTAHAILPAHDPRSSVYPPNVPGMCDTCHGDSDAMLGTGLRTNVHADYRKSVHAEALIEGTDLSAPACNDCHGNHGAVPPGVTSISQVCGTCHVNNLELFAATEMADAFEAEGVHLCEQCHGHHAVLRSEIDWVGTGDASICVDCHEEGDPGFVAAEAFHGMLSGLSFAIGESEKRRKEVSRIGLDDLDIEFELRSAHESLIRSRTLVHSFDTSLVAEAGLEGLEAARRAAAMADEQLAGYRKRRTGFGVATFFITLLAIGLFLRIRELDRGLDA